jgi:hypothetical protein
MAEDRHLALRASDAERERTADQLRHAAGEGRLTVEELDERLEAAYAARTRGELAALVADVDAQQLAAQTASDSGLRVRKGGDEGTRHLIAIMGGSDRRGHWRIARRCLSLNIMGGADLDLNDAELADDVVELTVFSLMGGADVHVPDGLNPARAARAAPAAPRALTAPVGGDRCHSGGRRCVCVGGRPPPRPGRIPT